MIDGGHDAGTRLPTDVAGNELTGRIWRGDRGACGLRLDQLRRNHRPAATIDLDGEVRRAKILDRLALFIDGDDVHGDDVDARAECRRLVRILRGNARGKRDQDDDGGDDRRG